MPVVKKVAMMLGDGFEPVEAIAPVDALRRGGVEVTTVSVMTDRMVMAAQGVPVVADAQVKEVSFDDFDMIVVPGGSGGVENLSRCQPLLDALKDFAAQRKFIGSICAGPTILANLQLLGGRKATCYPGCQTNFPEGVYQDVYDVVRDSNLITASGPGQALDFGIELLRALEGDKVAEDVAKGMLLER